MLHPLSEFQSSDAPHDLNCPPGMTYWSHRQIFGSCCGRRRVHTCQWHFARIGDVFSTNLVRTRLAWTSADGWNSGLQLRENVGLTGIPCWVWRTLSVCGERAVCYTVLPYYLATPISSFITGSFEFLFSVRYLKGSDTVLWRKSTFLFIVSIPERNNQVTSHKPGDILLSSPVSSSHILFQLFRKTLCL